MMKKLNKRIAAAVADKWSVSLTATSLVYCGGVTCWGPAVMPGPWRDGDQHLIWSNRTEPKFYRYINNFINHLVVSWACRWRSWLIPWSYVYFCNSKGDTVVATATWQSPSLPSITLSHLSDLWCRISKWINQSSAN